MKLLASNLMSWHPIKHLPRLLHYQMPPYPCKIDGVQMLCYRMETLVARNKNALRHCDWVSHVKIERGEVSKSNHLYDIRLFIEHIEVFKKPPEVDELPTLIYGSSKMHVNLEDDKEYLICGELIFENATYSSVGQLKPHGAEEGLTMAMEWEQFSPTYIDEMKAFLELILFYFNHTHSMKIRRETLTHLLDWHKSTLSEASWVSRVKILRKNEVPSTGIFKYLYNVQHIEIFKKPPTIAYLPTEVYGTFYGNAILRSRVGGEYLIRGGGTYWHSQTGDVPMREDESMFLERWEDLTEEYVEELKTFLRNPVA